MSSKLRITPFMKQCWVTGAVCANIVGHGCLIGYPAVLTPQLRESGAILLTPAAESWIVLQSESFEYISEKPREFSDYVMKHIEPLSAPPPSNVNRSRNMASVMSISLVVGNFLTPPLMGRAGRRVAHFAVTLPVIVGWFLIVLATGVQVGTCDVFDAAFYNVTLLINHY
ncbi:hypothetical protein EVAR_46873_1 [Eumeta japonica]|uniref:Uncharacterized protein n=1 Tax=Eumeta variegata TaxID=151549 RepID=A0A4C1XSB4_EUMVA|nr:hypothetical protein EVAR_46873_1 [Eumeta japonica]